MIFDYDHKSKSLFFHFGKDYKESVELGNHIILDYNSHNRLIGFEILF